MNPKSFPADAARRGAARAIHGLSVVVPVYDEEANVLPLAAEIAAALASIDLPSEIIFVDDGSRDETAARVEDAVKLFPHVLALRLARNRGQSAALLAGVCAASMSHVVSLDGDLQNDPADILRLLAQAPMHDVVIGRRRRRRDSLWRRLGSRIANGVRRAFLRDGSSDTGCSLKLFPREAFLALPVFDGMHRFLPALFRYQQRSICEVEVHHRARRAGRSKYGNLSRLPRTLVDLLGVMWLSRRTLLPRR